MTNKMREYTIISEKGETNFPSEVSTIVENVLNVLIDDGLINIHTGNYIVRFSIEKTKNTKI